MRDDKIYEMDKLLECGSIIQRRLKIILDDLMPWTQISSVQFSLNLYPDSGDKSFYDCSFELKMWYGFGRENGWDKRIGGSYEHREMVLQKRLHNVSRQLNIVISKILAEYNLNDQCMTGIFHDRGDCIAIQGSTIYRLRVKRQARLFF